MFWLLVYFRTFRFQNWLFEEISQWFCMVLCRGVQKTYCFNQKTLYLIKNWIRIWKIPQNSGNNSLIDWAPFTVPHLSPLNSCGISVGGGPVPQGRCSKLGGRPGVPRGPKWVLWGRNGPKWFKQINSAGESSYKPFFQMNTLFLFSDEGHVCLKRGEESLFFWKDLSFFIQNRIRWSKKEVWTSSASFLKRMIFVF